MNADFTLNEELFAEIGVPRISAQLMWCVLSPPLFSSRPSF
jgi:hypothetical protein